MSCGGANLVTKGIQLTATAEKVLPYNIHRKGILIGATGGDVKIAFGDAPADLDYLTIKDGSQLVFDDIVPVNDLWAKGTAVIVLGVVV